ncbi:hypothetical protein WICMUC_004346 [Wickerhamomyces mucosus]|uniref:Cullin family profile domain-containing protein n=1 Tax=Wickerhamomyces mucosus TaxID=1378264 RepID=A0A9P8PHT7_9ASCO|nr:hypothetical protein WICMUC_004346 [Wickerhamomyces mucosus]
MEWGFPSKINDIEVTHDKYIKNFGFAADMENYVSETSSLTPSTSNLNRSSQISPSLKLSYDELQQQISYILTDRSPTIGLQRLYKTVEFLCRDKNRGIISDELFQKIQDHIDHIVDTIFLPKRPFDPYQEIETFNEECDKLHQRIRSLEKIYMYLDRTYLFNYGSKKTIKDHGIYYLYSKLFTDANSKFGEMIFVSFLSCINDLRASNTAIEKEKVFKCFEELSNLLQFNFELLETKILENVEKSSTVIHGQILANTSPEERFERLLIAYEKELNIWEISNNKLGLKIKHISVKSLIFSNYIIDLSQILIPLLEYKKFDQVAVLYKFIQNSKDDQIFKVFLEVWIEYITNYLKSILETNDKEVVNKLVKSKRNFNVIIDSFMEGNSDILFKTRLALNDLIGSSKLDIDFHKQLQLFVDSFFKSLNPNDSINEKILDEIIEIFSIIKSKEQFVKTYERIFSRRVLLNLTKDIKLEESLAHKFEKVVGINACRNLLAMFKDLRVSENANLEFKNIYSNTPILFSALILKSDNWPKDIQTTGLNPSDLDSNNLTLVETLAKRENIPEFNQLLQIRSQFQELYTKELKYIIKWTDRSGSITLKYDFSKGIKELQMTEPMAVTLILFNHYETLTIKKLSKLTRWEQKDSYAVLYSLSEGKYKILIRDKHEYRINESFSDKKKVLKIKFIQVKHKNIELSQDNFEPLINEVILDDKHSIDNIKAFIVRSLKFEKSLTHDVLFDHVLAQFNVTTGFIKKIIDELIGLDYIGRVDQTTYYYIP